MNANQACRLVCVRLETPTLTACVCIMETEFMNELELRTLSCRQVLEFEAFFSCKIPKLKLKLYLD